MTNMKHQQGWTLTTPEGVTVLVGGELTLAGFILGCVGEDETVARQAICQCGGPACTVETGWCGFAEAEARVGSRSAAEHIVRWSPARVLAECEAKRRMIYVFAREYSEWGIGQGAAEALMSVMALPYADRPGYREEWRP